MLDSPIDEGQERPYKCPCGKSYLSYPALFTHVKQKHQGNVPLLPPSPQEKSSDPELPTNEEGPGKTPTNPPNKLSQSPHVCVF